MKIKFHLRDNDAILPSRANSTDVGLDLVAIKEDKTYDNGVIKYDTGVSVTPPDGYYTEIVARSSIVKTGWMLANNVGVIDPTYTGNLFIVLVRVVPDAPKLSLPFCKCQLVLKKCEYADPEEVDELTDTERGDGGFGSTGDRTGANTG